METLPSEIKLFVSKLSSEHRWQVLALPAPPPPLWLFLARWSCPGWLSSPQERRVHRQRSSGDMGH